MNVRLDTMQFPAQVLSLRRFSKSWILTFDAQEVIRAGRFLAAQIIPDCTDIPEDGISVKGIYGDEDRRKAGT